MSSRKAELLLAISTVFMGIGYSVSSLAMQSGLNSFQYLSIRYIIASLVMLIVFLKSIIRISKDEIKSGLILGFLVTFSFAFQTTGLMHTTVSNNAFLVSTKVVIVPFMYWIAVKKRPDIYLAIGVLLTVIGVALITLDGALHIGAGDLLSIIGAFFSAAVTVSASILLSKGEKSPVNITFMQFLTAAVLITLALPLTGSGLWRLTSGNIMYVLFAATFNTVGTYVLQNKAYRYTSPTRAGIILATDSIFSTVFSALFFHDIPGMQKLLGCAVIFCANIFSMLKPKIPFVKQNK